MEKYVVSLYFKKSQKISLKMEREHKFNMFKQKGSYSV